jgi:hypothetical protein
MPKRETLNTVFHPSEQRTRFAWWPVRLRRRGTTYLEDVPGPEGRVWLRRVFEVKTIYSGWVAFADHQHFAS